MYKAGSKSIKDWAVEDRPREKLLHNGTASLSNSELLAILIRAGSVNASAVDIAKHILSASQNNLNELGKWGVADYLKFNGIGEAKAITIMSALELGRRRSVEDFLVKPVVAESADVYKLMHPIMVDLPHEEFWAVYLNRANKVVAKERLSKGGVAGTAADVKLVMKRGIELLANSLIICHNHPSGNIQPSKSDREITQKFRDAGVIVELPVLDHIIIAENGYYSFADNE